VNPAVAAAIDRTVTEDRRHAPPGSTLVGVGWSTVDTDRLAEALRPAVTRDFLDAASDTALGARARAGALADGTALVLLEPSTEGRLAASLARLGEGPVVTWWRTVPPADAGPGAVLDGPFGPAWLVRDGRRDGRFLFLVASHGYHRPMTEPVTEGPALTLRPAASADADAIASLFTDEGYPAGPSDIVERLERFASPHSRVIVAEHEGELIGFIAVHALPRFEHDDRILRILALVVDAGARERGVGRALMAEAERIGQELGAAFVEITAGHHRPEARHLYESLGYDATVTAYLRKKL